MNQTGRLFVNCTMPACFFTTLRFLIWTFLGMGIVSCSRNGGYEPTVPSPPATEQPNSGNYPDSMKYLALGDSYTIGQGVKREERYPEITAAILRQEGIRLPSPEIIARTGWSTGDLLSVITQSPLSSKYDLVTLLIGVNNQFRQMPLSNYETEFQQLLQFAIGKAGGNRARVIVLSIPDYSVTPFARHYNAARIRDEIDQFNAANHAVTMREAVTYLDITGLSRTVPQNPDLLCSDSLHYSGRFYNQVAQQISAIALSRLK